MIYIGIDPGAKGALALAGYDDRLDTLGDKFNKLRNGPMIIPFDNDKYLDTLRDLKCADAPCICCIEQVHALRGNGVTSSFAFGKSFGWLIGVLDAFQIPYQPITPQKWKKEFGLSSDKAGSVEVCKRLFPGENLLRTERSRKEDDGMAEALLMALYAKRKF